jgi:hypothetical protein
MEYKKKTYNVLDEEQLDVYEEFTPKVRQILREYRKRRKLSAIASRLSINPARLAEMINKDGNGHYKRRITTYYLSKFFDGGVMTVEQVLNGRNLEDLPKRAQIFFERHILSRKTIRLVVEAQRRGIDIDKILELLLNPKNRNHEE